MGKGSDPGKSGFPVNRGTVNRGLTVYYKIIHSIVIVFLKFHCALVAAAVFAAAFSFHITSLEYAEGDT